MEKTLEKKNKHFILVHGFGHGAWSWYKLVSMLNLDGDYRVSAVDLGSCGINPKRLDEISSVSDYVQLLFDLIRSLPDDERVVLVAHSFGGVPISLAMETFPEKISVAVFVTAYMPNFEEPPAALIQEDVELAKMLIRPNKFFVDELSKESLLTKDKYGTTKRVFIICEGDEVMEEDFQGHMIERSPPDDVKSIQEAYHMVMLSKTQDLYLCLKKIAEEHHWGGGTCFRTAIIDDNINVEINL